MQPFDMYVIANGFPAGLNTADPPTDLGPDETPDGYGFELARDGRLAKNTTMATATSRVQKSISITEGAASIPYYWHYRRLWNITNRTASTASNILTFGARDYNDIFYPQTNGKIYFDEDANPVLAIVPFQPDSLFIVKASGSYVLGSLSDTRAFFTRTDIIQEMFAAAANRVCEMDNVIFVSNTDGLIGYENGKIVELTRKVRNDLTNFQNLALTVDYERKRIKGGSNFIFEMETGKLFRYSSTNFRYTTRQWHLPDYAPAQIDRLIFVVEHGDTEDGVITYQVKYEDESWGDEFKIKVMSEGERYTIITEDLEYARSTRRFQVRITDMDTNKYIKEIRLDRAAFSLDDYAT